MTTIQFLRNFLALPMSREKPCTVPTNGELKRWCEQKAILINGKSITHNEQINFPVFSLVFFPHSKHRTTMI